MTRELQSTLEDSRLERTALRNLIPCMAHVIEQALGAVMSSLGVKGRNKSWEAHEHDQQFGENESIHIRMIQRLRKECNTRINQVSAMRPGLVKIIEKLCISRDFHSPEMNLHMAENACHIGYADTWSSKRVHWLSKSQSPHRSTTNYGFEDTLEIDTGVAWASQPIRRIHLRVAPESEIQWLLATLHNTGWLDHCQVHPASLITVPILDHVDVEGSYGHIPSRYHTVQWH